MENRHLIMFLRIQISRKVHDQLLVVDVKKLQMNKTKPYGNSNTCSSVMMHRQQWGHSTQAAD